MGRRTVMSNGRPLRKEHVGWPLLHFDALLPVLHVSEREKAMRTKLWSLILALTILFVIGGTSVFLRPAVAASEKTTHLKFLVKFIGEDLFLDLGAPGFSQGDEFILHDLVFTPDGGTQVGHNGGMCVIFDAAVPESNCTSTYSLPHGDITVQFL